MCINLRSFIVDWFNDVHLISSQFVLCLLLLFTCLLLARMAYNNPTEPPVMATAPYTVGGGNAGTPVRTSWFQVPATHDPPHMGHDHGDRM